MLTRIPRAQVWRRGTATAIDFILAWFASALLGANQPLAQAIAFLLTWAALRVILVLNNQGQSFGHWALNMKVVDANTGRAPLVADLARREGAMGGAALLALFGLSFLFSNPGTILLIIPLAVDCSFAFADPMLRQALHDRWGRTCVISTRRGYSLDLKVKKIFAQARNRVK